VYFCLPLIVHFCLPLPMYFCLPLGVYFSLPFPKPDNLFFLDGKYVLGDFGLVDFPEKNHVTQRGEEIGPKWTIAPEMRRNPENAQGGPADIYSLAKTLWILLKRKYKGFDGQYNKTSIDSLGTNVRGFYASRIGDLIHNCTDNDPEKRLSTEDFTKELEKSLKENKDYEAKTKKQWKDLILSIFPKRRISRAFWEGEEILEILGNISAEKELTHILFPDGGGLDLLGVKKSSERGCIELNTAPQGIYIIKPKKLIFESFSADFQFDYFRLETEPLKSSGLYEMGREAYSEALTELRPGEYTLYECWIHNDFNAKDLPKKARPIVRCLQGDLLIVRNTSDYLKISDFYGGIHAKMNTNEFRMFILRSLLKSSKLQNEKVKENDKKIKFARPRKFKSPSRRLIDKEFKLINKIVELAKNRKLEAEILEKKYEIKRFVLYPRNKKEEEYLSAERPEKNKLKNFLIKLTQRDLTLITVVMYGGREFRHPFSPAPLDELINDLCDNEHLVEKLMEKAPLDKYLEKGLEAYS